tara:strand:+ start:292 stop:489 length:198 start_codon:yes stop_codon:yes gene_type:complete
MLVSNDNIKRKSENLFCNSLNVDDYCIHYAFAADKVTKKLFERMLFEKGVGRIQPNEALYFATNL